MMRRLQRQLWWIVPVLVVIILSVIGFKKIDQPPQAPQLIEPEQLVLNEAAKQLPEYQRVIIDANSSQRDAQQLTLRVRNVSCSAMGTGSGFALDEHTIITNEHVLSAAAMLELNTWDGRTLRVKIDDAKEHPQVDLGVIRVEKRLDEDVDLGDPAKVGEAVSVIGYPQGGPLTVTKGKVLGYVPGASLRGIEIDGPVMRLSAQIQPGSSGGPVLDEEGKLVAVIYAGLLDENEKSLVSYAIPVRTLTEQLNSSTAWQPVTPCAG